MLKTVGNVDVLLSSQVGSYSVSQILHFITYEAHDVKRLLTLFATLIGDREEVQVVCAGKEFRLPVFSTSRTVTFKPDFEGQRRVLLENTIVRNNFSLFVFLFVYYVPQISKRYFYLQL